jgi:hypothetical protein
VGSVTPVDGIHYCPSTLADGLNMVTKEVVDQLETRVAKVSPIDETAVFPDGTTKQANGSCLQEGELLEPIRVLG